jgi:hypothetical protein
MPVAAAAITCASVILCIVGIIVAAILAIIAAVLGALAGGQIAKAASENDTPTGVPSDPSSGSTREDIAVGDYITVRGNMQLRKEDNGANVLWWVSSTILHGAANDDVPKPFSYCEVNDDFTDGCETASTPIG